MAKATAPQRQVLRAKIVLVSGRGEATATIARELGICVDTVRTWRSRFRQEGMPGLSDRPRSGRPPIYGIEDQLLIVATVTGTTPETDSQWTHRALAEHLAEPVGIRASQIGVQNDLGAAACDALCKQSGQHDGATGRLGFGVDVGDLGVDAQANGGVGGLR